MSIRRLAAVVLMILAVALIGDGCWIKAKAVLAQVLLQRAWQQTLATGKPAKAWPWADTWPVARLTMKRLGVDDIVLEGQSGAVLAFGPGRLIAGAQPNANGNCVLAGHRDTSFSFLAGIRKGDRVSLQSRNKTKVTYRVMSTAVVRADELYLHHTAGPWLTLVTCYPFDDPIPGSPFRFVVFAKKIGPTGNGADRPDLGLALNATAGSRSRKMIRP